MPCLELVYLKRLDASSTSPVSTILCRNAFTEENSSVLLPNARVYRRKHENVTN